MYLYFASERFAIIFSRLIISPNLLILLEYSLQVVTQWLELVTSELVLEYYLQVVNRGFELVTIHSSDLLYNGSQSDHWGTNRHFPFDKAM